MQKVKKIGWQKYEDLLEKQMSNPIIPTIMRNILKLQSNIINQEEDEDGEDYGEDGDEAEPMIFPMSQALLEDISMLSNFDCWIGHTNFNITPEIKNKLDKVEGVEVLKICSRYRFFIGVGTMFNFKEVRKNIEKELLEKE